MIKKFKEINIGELIEYRVKECKIDRERITKYLAIDDQTLDRMYESSHIDTETLLKWCKLLDYDFFRLYTQHLIFYSPISSTNTKQDNESNSKLPIFKKSIYTIDVINYIVEQINTEKMSKKEVMVKYNIPKTTLYKWLSKYN